MKSRRIAAVHLLNDFSGSPLVFKQALEVLHKTYEIHLFTATPSGEGFLTKTEGVTAHRLFYNWHKNKYITLCLFSWSQILLFVKLLFWLKKNDVVYINTLLPFGAALAAKFRNNKVVYHVHEVSIKPKVFKRFLVNVAQNYSQQIVFVSHYLSKDFSTSNIKSTVIYNALPNEFVSRADEFTKPKNNSPFTVLMLCSLKAYKGINEFVALAKKMPHCQFNLVLNSDVNACKSFTDDVGLPQNCTLFPTQNQTSSFYEDADIVVNLSNPNLWIETFGMTILEGMHYGLPAIVPPVGGVTELITDGLEGYQVNSNDIQQLVEKINRLSLKDAHYLGLANAAKNKASKFSQQIFADKILEIFN